MLSVCSFHAALVIQANGESSISEEKAGRRKDSDLLCVPVAGESGRLHSPVETANHTQGSSLLESFATQSAPTWKAIKTDTLSFLSKRDSKAGCAMLLRREASSIPDTHCVDPHVH